MIRVDAPLGDRCSNQGFSDRWTCCACYAELDNIGEGDHTCSNCGARIRCSLDYEPVCRTELLEEDQDNVQET